MKIPITFYHGTTIENVQQLSQSHWDWTAPYIQNWTASWPNKIYAWCGPMVSFTNLENPIFSKEQQNNEKAIQYALENAQVAAAIQNSHYKDLIILGYFEEIEIKKLPNNYEELQGLIETQLEWTSDYSSEGMNGSFEISKSELQGRIPDVFYIGKEAYSPILRSVLFPININDCCLSELTETEQKLLRIMKKNETLAYLPLELIEQSECIEVKNIEQYLKQI